MSDKVKRTSSSGGSESKPKAAPIRPAYLVLPSILAAAHGAFLASNYDSVIADYNKSGRINVELWVPATLASLYVIGVWVGCKLMKQREQEGKPGFNVSEAMLVYNIYATILSAFMGFGILKEAVLSGKGGFHEEIDRTAAGANLAYVLWVNYHSKFIEYCDTVFMISRYSWKQVSFLHVSHHTEMGLIMWLVNDLAPGGNSYFGPMINSFVHTIMYAYYGLSGLGVRVPFKAAITIMQQIQFIAIMAQSIYLLLPDNYNRHWPAVLGWASIALMTQMLLMFGAFSMSEYCSKGDKEGKGAKVQEGEEATKGADTPASADGDAKALKTE